MLKFLELLHLRDVNYNESYYVWEKPDNITKHYNYDQFIKSIRDYENKQDVYLTPNAFISPRGKRSYGKKKDNVTVLKNIFMDLDVLEKTDYDIVTAHIEILQLVQQGVIPMPTMIICSGRGLHLYWSIGAYKATTSLIAYYIKLTKCLYDKLKYLGADKSKITDYSAVLRLPGTVNSRNNSRCYVVESHNLSYTMKELQEVYFKNNVVFKPKPKKVIQTKLKVIEGNNEVIPDKSKAKLAVAKTAGTLNSKRCSDIEKLIKLRNYNMTGCRENTLFLLAIFKFGCRKDYLEILEYLEIINNSFKNSNDSKVMKAINSAENYYKQGKKLRYTHEKLIELLKITEEEQRQLDVIINSEVKENRRRERRRNEEGLTAKQQQKKNTRESVQLLKSKGLTQSQISKTLDKSIRTVKTYWN